MSEPTIYGPGDDDYGRPKVVALTAVTEAKREFNNAAAVAFCEDLLSRAKSGEIKHLAVAAMSADNKVQHAWSSAEGVRTVTMVGGITMLQHEYIRLVVSYDE